MPPSNPVSAFTIKSTGGLLRVLVTDASILVPGGGGQMNVKAIWDTGATGSAITDRVVSALGLVPTGMAQVHTAGGVINQNTYTIDMRLPNGVVIMGIIATCVPLLSSGSDSLIGMDVISLGDFSVTNHRGVTCMSFRTPSSHEIDYVKNPTYGMTPIKHPPGTMGSNRTLPKKKRKK
jgi:hypothetical protein